MSTINKEEIEKFSKLSEEWWDPSGKFAPLHKLNPIRLEFIKTQLILYFRLNEKSQEPLGNLDILDIGCGGGILSEPISRLGANVTGMDAAKKNINVAKIHSKQMGLKINYINSSPENFKGSKKFDVILNMEIIEHVLNPDLFVKSCAKLLKKMV